MITCSSVSAYQKPEITATRRRILSPPPRHQQRTSIPPVPPIPRRWSMYQSLPMRPHPPTFTPPPLQGVVRPIDRPFDFEAGLGHPRPTPGPSNNLRRRFPQPQLPSAAPPSHHVPTMGLGGALISTNRARIAQQREERRLRLEQRAAGHMGYMQQARSAASNAMRRMYGAAGNGINIFALRNVFGPFEDNNDIDDEHDEELALQMLIADAEAVNPFSTRFFSPNHIFRQHGPSRHREDEYKPAYTHPLPPDPGFTHDFAPVAPPTSSPKPTIIPLPSPRSNPIVIDVDSDDTSAAGPSSSPILDATPPSPQNLTVNTLLVCARCLDPLILSEGATKAGPDEEHRRRVWGLRCGHLIDGKCLEELSRPPDTATADIRGKGKGKAKTVVPSEDDNNSDQQEQQQEDALPRDSIRSRLRSRNPRAPPLPTAPSSGPAAPPPPSSSATKRKRRSSDRVKIEAEHEWTCPVAGCGKVHASVKVAGAWVPEKEHGKGAIGVFV